MATPVQLDFLSRASLGAKASGHIFPGAAAAEAALESAWGTSKLCQIANNLFGLKKPSGWTGRTVEIDTREFLKGKWVVVPAVWPVYDSWAECFTERMKVLQRNPSIYGTALSAPSPEVFIREVSRRWATDLDRGNKVLSIYRSHLDILDK
jgi:flagellum-specific peptidoglycan hydrolase FlgJ